MEAWDAKYKPNLDWNHAWGAAPANIIPSYLMGIRPVEPGFAKVRIKPQVGSLESGSMDLPTIRGTIHVDFNSVKDRSFVLNVRAPANIEAIVYLPRLGRDDPDVLMDGQTVQGTLTGRFVVVDGVAPGAHRFERTGKG
jgi:alpha-L-rhamnosidase